MSTSVREYAILYVGGKGKGGSTIGGGNAILNAGQHALDGPEHTGRGDLHTPWTLVAGGIIGPTEGDPPLGAIVVQVKTSAGAPSHSASRGTPCWVAPDELLYVNSDGATTWVEVGAADLFLTKINGGGDTIMPHGSMGATEPFDPADGNVHTGTLNANCTVTIAEPTGAAASTLVGWFTLDGVGGWTLDFACAAGGSFAWDGGTPTLPTAAGTTFRVVFERVPGTTNDWIGVLVGGAGGSAFTVSDEGTPLDTAVTSIDVVGGGATATNTGHAVTFTIPGTTADDVRDAGVWVRVTVPGSASPPDDVYSPDGTEWVYAWVTG